MSDKWETVKTSKQGGGGKPKAVANGKPLSKKQEAKIYTMEDVLPASSVENMYASAFDPTPPSPKKKEANGNAKPVAATKTKEKRVEKPSVPGTLQEAVKQQMRVEDLKNLIESSQQRFPDSPLLWLRDVAAYLNLKLVTDPPTEGDILGGLPASALTVNMRKVINVMLGKCTDSMKETFFETCVANTAHDLAKGLCVAGWRVLTQMLAEVNPSLVTAHIPRYVELRNSYQNRPAIGLAILWSVGQAGLKSLHSGIKVWLDIMLPVMTMRHYSKFVVEYLSALLAAHSVTPTTSLNKSVMDIPNFLTVQDSVFIQSNQMNKEYARQLKDLYPRMRAIAVAGCKNHELFPALLGRLANLSTPDQMMDTLELLATCLSVSPAALVHWHKLYISHLNESGQLLQYLESNWTKYKSSLDVPVFQETIEAFSDYNESVSNKEGLLLATEGCDSLSARLSGPSMAWFPWKTLSFLLLIFTAAIINLDLERAGGSFSDSSTGQFLTDLGQYDRVWAGYQWCLQCKKWADATMPLYWQQVRQVAGPVADQAGEIVTEAGALAAMGLAKAQEAWQAGLVKLEELLPGVKGQVAQVWGHLQQACLVILARGQEVGQHLVNGIKDLLKGEVDWVAVKVGAEDLFFTLKKQLLSALNYVQLQINQLVK